jgi:hypothetical protein
MAAVGDIQLIAGRNMQIRIVDDLVPVGDVVYITNPQALLSLKHTGPILKPGHDDEIHNWSTYLMSYDTIEPHTQRWYTSPVPVLAWAQLPRPNPQEFYNQMLGEPFVVERDPDEVRRQERLAALQRIRDRQRDAILTLPSPAYRPSPIWMP